VIHSAPDAASAAAIVTSDPKLSSALALTPLPSRIAPRPQRAALLTRRYETAWLTADGQVETATRIAPALPQFEEAFSALARGTLLETPRGMVAVEDLEPGAQLLSSDGSVRQAVWIGSMTLFPPHAVPGLPPSMMTRITADAFGGGRPMPDLVLGQQARLLLKGARAQAAGHNAAYAPARSLIDGDGIIEVTPVAPVAMYHIVLDRHGSLRCAGVEVESYHPGDGAAQRFDPQLAALFLAMFPQIGGFDDFGPMALPRLAADEAGNLLAA
jgi:Hint domain